MPEFANCAQNINSSFSLKCTEQIGQTQIIFSNVLAYSIIFTIFQFTIYFHRCTCTLSRVHIYMKHPSSAYVNTANNMSTVLYYNTALGVVTCEATPRPAPGEQTVVCWLAAAVCASSPRENYRATDGLDAPRRASVEPAQKRAETNRSRLFAGDALIFRLVSILNEDWLTI